MAQHSRIARSLATALVVMFQLSVAPARAHAQVEEVKITVEGMTCNLCAAGLERSLRRVEGVAAVKVVLASQAATIRLKPGVAVAPALLRAAVENAGQRLRVVELRLRGTLQRDKGLYQLRPAGLAQVFAVRNDVKLEPLAGRNVRVRGRVVSSGAAAVELELMDVEP
jgi:copper chaperone CopZ